MPCQLYFPFCIFHVVSLFYAEWCAIEKFILFKSIRKVHISIKNTYLIIGEYISIACDCEIFTFNPPKWLMFQHFIPALFLGLEGSVLGFGLYAVFIWRLIKISLIYISPFTSNQKLDSFTFCKCLYNRQQFFCFFSWYSYFLLFNTH